MPDSSTPQPRPNDQAATRSSPRRGWLARALVGLAFLWAAGWSAFAAAASSGEDWRGRVIAVAFCLAALGPVLLAWRRPLLGGLVMLGLGIGAFRVLHPRAAMVGLIIPEIAFGAAFALEAMLRARRRRRACRRANRAG